MKFEQAFYTRRSGTGLYLAGCSVADAGYRNKCGRVCGEFGTEDSEQTAEFVFYSKELDRFVAAGVSPADYDNRAGKNKLVHLLVPVEKSENPDDCYLEYPFRKTMGDESAPMEQLSVDECLSRSEFEPLLHKYFGEDAEKLAAYLQKLCQLLLGNKPLLVVQLDPDRHDVREYGEIARELSWLSARLIPLAGEDLLQCRQNLSYNVYSTVNYTRTKLTYQPKDKEISGRNVLFYSLDDGEESDGQELYRTLAETALNSLDAYEHLAQELQDHKIRRTLDERCLQLMYLSRTLAGGAEITGDDLPVTIRFLVMEAKSSPRYRELLYRCVLALDDLSEEDLDRVWKEIVLSQTEEGDQGLFCTAAARMITLMHGRNPDQAQAYLSQIPQSSREAVIRRLYEQQDSFIRAEQEQIKTAAGLVEFLNRYPELREEVAGHGETLYFEKGTSKEERKSISSQLEPLGFAERVIQSICGFFSGGEDSYLTFLDDECDRIEDCYASRYFQCFLDRSGKETTPDRIRRCRSTGDRLLESCRGLLTQEQEQQYSSQVAAWEIAELDEDMKPLSLEELAELQIPQGKDHLMKHWISELTDRLERAESLSDRCLTGLLKAARTPQTAEAVPDQELLRFKEAGWQRCKGSYPHMVRWCAAMPDYSLWDQVPLMDTGAYEQLYRTCEGMAEFQTLQTDANGNSACYGIWKRIEERQPCARLTAEHGLEPQEAAFLNGLRGKIRARGTCSDADIYNYIMLTTLTEMQGGSAAARCQRYRAFLREDHLTLTQGILHYQGFPRPLTDQEKQWIAELSLFTDVVELSHLLQKAGSREEPLPDELFAELKDIRKQAAEQFGDHPEHLVELAVLDEEYDREMAIGKTVIEAAAEQVMDDKAKIQKWNRRTAAAASLLKHCISKLNQLEDKLKDSEEKFNKQRKKYNKKFEQDYTVPVGAEGPDSRVLSEGDRQKLSEQLSSYKGDPVRLTEQDLRFLADHQMCAFEKQLRTAPVKERPADRGAGKEEERKAPAAKRPIQIVDRDSGKKTDLSDWNGKAPNPTEFEQIVKNNKDTFKF